MYMFVSVPKTPTIEPKVDVGLICLLRQPDKLP